MRFSEAVQLNTLRAKLSNLLEYVYNWEQFDPICPTENIEKIDRLREEVNTLLQKVETKMEELGSINVDSFEY